MRIKQNAIDNFVKDGGASDLQGLQGQSTNKVYACANKASALALHINTVSSRFKER